MRIGIIAPLPVPPMEGGAEAFWRGLHNAFRTSTPHDIELVKLPVREFTLPDLMRSYRSFSELDTSRFDMVITSKYPAWMVDHPNHIVYMLHKLRGLYDTYDRIGIPRLFDDPGEGVDVLISTVRRDGTPPAAIYEAFDRAIRRCGADHPSFGFPSPLARELVHSLDRWALSPKRIRKYMSLSTCVSRRDDYFPLGVPVEVLPTPPDLSGFHSAGNDHIFTASRLDPPKRIDLIIEAMGHVSHPVPLIIAGVGPEEERLRALALGDPRIEFRGWVTDSEKVDLYARAIAVPFVPLDEDMGLVTQEAMLSGKPVVTATDSGGAIELIQDGVNGLICQPDPRAVGAALSQLIADPARARRMGERGRKTARTITWSVLTSAMLRGADPATAFAEPAWRGRPRIVVASTYQIGAGAHGGALRCRNLYRGLLGRHDVHIVSLGDRFSDPGTLEIEPGMFETVVPTTESFLERERALFGDVGVPISDITAAALYMEVPEYVRRLRRAARAAQAIVLAHPYLFGAVRAARARAPVIHDSHNAEFVMKRAMLPRTPAGDRLSALVLHIEGRAVRDTAKTVVCSADDRLLLSTAFGAHEEGFSEVANGVDLGRVTFTTGDRRRSATRDWLKHAPRPPGSAQPEHIALFVGSWHAPNVEAAEQIFRMAPLMPNVLFVIAGGMDRYFEEWSVPANVALIGRVSEATKMTMLKAATVALNPMLSGGGTNLKILEYMAAGVPVITTAIGTRAIAAEGGVHHVVAPIRGFPAAIREIAGDPAEADRRCALAHNLMCQQYDWHTLGERMSGIVDDVIARFSAAAPPRSAAQ